MICTTHRGTLREPFHDRRQLYDTHALRLESQVSQCALLDYCLLGASICDLVILPET